MFVEAFGYGVVAPTLPFLARSFGASDWQIALLVGMYAAPGLVAIIPLSALATRYGRRCLILLGLACLSLASLGFVLAPTYPWLVLARAIQGVAASAVWVGALSAAADLTPDASMGRSLSWITGSWSLGFFLGPFIGGLGAVRTPFLIYAALSLVALLAASLGLPETGRAGARTTMRGIVRVLRLPAVLASGVATFTLSFYWGVFEAFVPLLLSDEAGAGRLTIGTLFAIATLPSIVLPRLTGYLADRAGDARIITFGLLYASVLTGGFLTLFRSAMPLWLLFLMLGLMDVVVYIPAVALLNRGQDRDGRVIANASHNLAFSAGFFTGPALGGLVVTLGGRGMAFVMLAAITLAAAVAVAAIRPGGARLRT
ncbi:MAG: MFS transporter [Acidobacteriota bacterium]